MSAAFNYHAKLRFEFYPFQKRIILGISCLIVGMNCNESDMSLFVADTRSARVEAIESRRSSIEICNFVSK